MLATFSSLSTFFALVDFINCSRLVYGILIVYQMDYKISFLPLTPASPPVPGTIVDVAGDGTSGNVDGVGSAARIKVTGYVTSAHTVAAWFIAGYQTESIRLAVFVRDAPLRLNVTTLIATTGKLPFGVVTTNDDSTLYASFYTDLQIQTVLNPLSANPTLGPVLSFTYTFVWKISLHRGCESLLLIGCQGDYLLVYNITSQSIIHTQYSRAAYPIYLGSLH